MNQRGNVVAFIAIAIIVLVFVLMLSRHEPVQIRKDINTESKVETITSENIRRATRLGLQKFAKSGYSGESGSWVCNIFMPPLADEVDINFGNMLYKDLNGHYFRKIREELGYDYEEEFSASLGLLTGGDIYEQKAKMLSLPNGLVDVNVNFVLVETGGEDENRKLDNSMVESYPYRKWHLYKKYLEWGENYLPILGEDICNELTKAHPCLFSACGPPSSGIMIPDDAVKKFVNLNKIQIDWALDKQLNYLNSLMNPFDFECEMVKTSESKELFIARRQRCDHCIYPCGIVSNMKACGSWGGPSGIGCPNRDPLGPWIYPPGAPPLGSQTTNCPADLNKHEAVTANSFVKFSFDFICEDNTRSISGEPDVQKSTATIGVVAGISRTCPPIYMCPQGK